MNRAITVLSGAVFAVAISFISATPAHADDFTVCPSGMTGVATDDTSCAFAENVRSAWGALPGNVVTAYSPVTQQSYLMQCVPTVTNPWPAAQRCVGTNSYGVSLIVYIATPAGGAGPIGQSPINSQQNGTGLGIGVDSPNAPNTNMPNGNIPSANVPNVGCTWVNGYTKKNGTHVSGYWRC